MAGLFTLMVNVVKPEPVTVDGLKLPEARVGTPATLNETVPVNPLTAAIVTENVVLALRATVRDVGVTESVKSGAPAVTTSVTLAVCVNVPSVPVIVSG